MIKTSNGDVSEQSHLEGFMGTDTTEQPLSRNHERNQLSSGYHPYKELWRGTAEAGQACIPVRTNRKCYRHEELRQRRDLNVISHLKDGQ